MLGRVCAAVALVVLLAPAVDSPVVDEAAAGNPFTKELRRFGFEGVKLNEAAFQLSTAENYDTYYFVIESDPLITIQEDPQQIAAGYLEVKRFGTNDLICRGAVSEYQELHKHQICGDLRVGHPYILTYVLAHPADLYLFGHNK